MTEFGGLMEDKFALPPRGVTTTSEVKLRGETIRQWTYVCENEDCYAIAYSRESEDSARMQLSGHACPEVYPSRGLIPSGKTLLQKMWDEADDAMDAYKAGEDYKGMDSTHGALGAFIRGIAECISFCAVPEFRVVKDVARELDRRWKMRQHLIPFSPTPTYHSYCTPFLDAERAKSKAATPVAVKTSAPTKPKKAPSHVLPTPQDVTLTIEQRNAVREAFHVGTMSASQLAEAFGVSKERIIAIAGPKPTVRTNLPVINTGLF